MVTGLKVWAPKSGNSEIRTIRFIDAFLKGGTEMQTIAGVGVKIFCVSKSVIDCFRHRSKVARSIVIEGLKESLRQRKARPTFC